VLLPKQKIFFIIISLGTLLFFSAVSQGNFVRADGLTLTPTIDRLAKPTLPANPDMADRGSQDYWLYCSPCHGDKAQGLTDDFRKQYPIEDQYCWNSGCHGKRPYPNGWTIPRYVPPLVGETAIKRFANGAVLKEYIQTKMPFQIPGQLKEAEYWRLTGFLLKQNGYWNGVGELNEITAASIIISENGILSLLPTSTIGYSTNTPQAHDTPVNQGENSVDDTSSANSTRVMALGILLLIAIAVPIGIKLAKNW
jgi:hypothetical protein